MDEMNGRGELREGRGVENRRGGNRPYAPNPRVNPNTAPRLSQNTAPRAPQNTGRVSQDTQLRVSPREAEMRRQEEGRGAMRAGAPERQRPSETTGRQPRPRQELESARRQPEAELSAPELARQYQGNDEDKSVDALLDRMEDNLHEAKKMPFTEQCVIDREEMLFLIGMLRSGLPEELRQAKWLLQQNRQLLLDARKEADNILRDAEQQMARMINEHEVTQKAELEANRILDEASAQSRQMRNSVVQYARQLMAELEEQLTDMLVFIQKNKKELEQ